MRSLLKSSWPGVLTDPGFGLYLHWPFCQAKCPYCDFNSHVASSIDHDTWGDAFVSELERVALETGDRFLDSVYFGGGTPSLMEPRVVERILAAAHRLWGFANDVEITLEANPTSVEAGRLLGFRAAGVNRVSLGVQALRDSDLRALGRMHTAREAIAAVHIAQKTFDRSSFDLIYARQDQRLEDWSAELAEALDMAGGHLSLYQLTIEPETVFGVRARAGHLKGLPDENLQADMYEATQEICGAAGLPAYEISNHAIPGQESRHNLIYWRGGDWLGIGPGAHGRLTLAGQRVLTVTPSSPGEWLSAVRGGGRSETREQQSTIERAEEYLMMGLRLREGVALSRLVVLKLDKKIKALCDIGVLETDGRRVFATDRGRPVLNEILRQLLGD